MIKKNEVVTIIGGNGFVGSSLVREIAKLGIKINVLARTASKHLDLKVNGYVGQIALIDLDIDQTAKLDKIIKNSDYVINLIGILFEKRKRTFEALHTNFPKIVAEMCKKHKIKRFIHFSALGVDTAKTSKYAKSKLSGETNVKNIFPESTIIRPSVIFGPDDNFTNLFNWMSKISPFLPLIGGGKSLFQPVYVDDIARVIKTIIADKSNKYKNLTIELGGPEQLSFEEILNTILETSGRNKILLPIPFSLAKIKGRIMEFTPKPLLTRDQVELLKYDNIVKNENGFSQFNVSPQRLGSILSKYIK